jgi:hypothetical protein
VDEAVAEHERAKALDSLIPFHTTWLPGLYWFSGDYEWACTGIRDLVAGPYADEPVANLVLGRTAAFLGLHDEAISANEKLLEVAPLVPLRPDGETLPSGMNPASRPCPVA